MMLIWIIWWDGNVRLIKKLIEFSKQFEQVFFKLAIYINKQSNPGYCGRFLTNNNNNTRMSKKFCNVLVCAYLQHVYHRAYAIQAVEGTCFCMLYHGCWCADTLCIASLHAWFESHTDAYAIFENLCFMVLNLAIMPSKQSKTYTVWKVKVQLIIVPVIR